MFEISNENINNIVNGNTNIECTAKYNNIYYHKTLYIELTETPYELELNKNILTRDVNLGTTGQITDVSLVASVKYWDNTTGEWVYTNKGSLKLKDGDYTYNFDTNEKDYIYYKRTLTIADSLLQNTTSSELRISYYNDNTTDELTYEIIGIINSGKDGNTPNPPHCTSVNIIGYSLNESITITSGFNGDNENYSDKWFKSLDKLGVITSRAKIYMLNEFTWSDGEPTYSITVTLAGTQGVDGKSRVLFYLGSFEKNDEKGITPTLSGESVEGKLTNERCDYYIDADGHAWMRAGTAKTATGYANGNNNSSEWLLSEKVGFLQADAITADMINTESLATDSAFISKLFTQEIEANNLKVNAANIIGTLTIGGGSDSDNCVIIDGEIPNDNIPMISGTKIEDGAITTDKIAAYAITAGKIDVTSIYSDIITAGKGEIETIVADKISATDIDASKITGGLIDASHIDVDNLSVSKLNTTPTETTTTKGRITISDNDIKVYSNDSDNLVLKLTGENFNSQESMPQILTKSITYTYDSTSSYSNSKEVYTHIYLKDFTINDVGYNYDLSMDNITGSLIISSDWAGGVTKIEYNSGLNIYCDAYLVRRGDSIPPNFDGENLGTITGLSFTQGNTYTRDLNISVKNGKNLKPGTYGLYVRIYFQKFTYNSPASIYRKIEINGATLSYNLTPILTPKTYITQDGFRIIKSSTDYFELDSNGYLTQQCSDGSYKLTSNAQGFKINYGDSNYFNIGGADITMTQTNTSNGKKYGLEIDSIGIYMYIDNIKYKVTRNSSGYLILSII